jgi:hypothetical protein
MTTLQLDLHTHSPLVPTDYRGPVETTARTIVEASLRTGLGLLAVTDHFSVRYVHRIEEAAIRYAEESGKSLAVLAGAEIKVRWEGDEAHLIALLPPDSYSACFEELSAGFGIDQKALPVSELPAVKVDAHPCDVARRVAGLGRALSHRPCRSLLRRVPLAGQPALRRACHRRCHSGGRAGRSGQPCRGRKAGARGPHHRVVGCPQPRRDRQAAHDAAAG